MLPLIVNFTPTGMVPTKESNPSVPLDAGEIVEQVIEAYELGITIAHLHAREEDGTPAHRVSAYVPIFEGLRKHCPDLVLCATLSGRNVTEVAERAEVLELQPDMGSLTLGSLNFPSQASVNSPDTILKLIGRMHAAGVTPELECFGFGMINYATYLIRKEILRPPYYYNIILGNLFGAQPNLSELGLLVERLPEDALWSLGGIGSAQITANTIAIASGGGVRVGLEDNIWYDRNRSRPATNIDLLRRVHHLAEIHERRIMEPSEFGGLGFYNDNVQRPKQ